MAEPKPQASGAARPIPFKPQPAKPQPSRPAGLTPPGARPRSAPASSPAVIAVAPPAGKARRRPRHLGLLASFLALVALPTALSGGYLGLRAVDQYASTVGFAVQSENSSTMLNILGGITQLAGASDSQAAMVYEYLQSRDLVERLDARLNLRRIFAAPHRTDPVFAFDPAGSVEDLVDYWHRMTTVTYDPGTGLLTLEVHAFSAAQAREIAAAAFDEASRMINELSDIAQADTMRLARDELQRTEERLRQARAALQSFRERSQMIDPAADFSGRMGVINALQSQLATALVTLGLLEQTARPGDPRLTEAERLIAVTRAQIASERRRFGTAVAAADPATLAELTGHYERLSAELDFAGKAYAAALTALDGAQAAARQQSLYLAAYQKPAAAQAAEYPRRVLLTGLVALFGLLIWSVLALVYYSLRDRR